MSRGHTKTSMFAVTRRIGTAMSVVATVAASSSSQRPRRLAMIQAASGQEEREQLGQRVGQEGQHQRQLPDVELRGQGRRRRRRG